MILLSFDIEEFDMPFEYQKEITFEEQIAVSKAGTIIILDLLKKHHIKATFFSTLTFAQNIPDLIQRIKNEGHELASHGVHHSAFKPEDLKTSLVELEKLSGLPVKGFRMPRMQFVDQKVLKEAGYLYNSSLHPTWLPGRYNHFFKPRKYFKEDGLLQLPASVSPLIRFPLFWLSFHNLPLWLYQFIAFKTLKNKGYLNIYFHPWEFTNLNYPDKYGFPEYISKNSGEIMTERMDEFIKNSKSKGYVFDSIINFIDTIDIEL